MPKITDAWDAHLLWHDHNLGLRFSDGWVFFRVDNFEDIPTYYWTTSQIPALGTLDYQTPKEGNNEIIYTRIGDQIIQTFIGLNHPKLRLFRRIPAGKPVGVHPELSAPTLTGNFGFVEGWQSPFDEPTGMTKMYIPYNIHVEFGFANPEQYQVTPNLAIYMRILKVKPLDPSVESDVQVIKDIVAKKIPCDKYCPSIYPYDYPIEATWNVKPIRWDSRGNLILPEMPSKK